MEVKELNEIDIKERLKELASADLTKEIFSLVVRDYGKKNGDDLFNFLPQFIGLALVFLNKKEFSEEELWSRLAKEVPLAVQEIKEKPERARKIISFYWPFLLKAGLIAQSERELITQGGDDELFWFGLAWRLPKSELINAVLYYLLLEGLSLYLNVPIYKTD